MGLALKIKFASMAHPYCDPKMRTATIRLLNTRIQATLDRWVKFEWRLGGVRCWLTQKNTIYCHWSIYWLALFLVLLLEISVYTWTPRNRIGSLHISLLWFSKFGNLIIILMVRFTYRESIPSIQCRRLWRGIRVREDVLRWLLVSVFVIRCIWWSQETMPWSRKIGWHWRLQSMNASYLRCQIWFHLKKHTLREHPKRAYIRSCIIISMAHSAIAPAILDIRSKATQLFSRISWHSLMVLQVGCIRCIGGISRMREKVDFGDIQYNEGDCIISHL